MPSVKHQIGDHWSRGQESSNRWQELYAKAQFYAVIDPDDWLGPDLLLGSLSGDHVYWSQNDGHKRPAEHRGQALLEPVFMDVSITPLARAKRRRARSLGQRHCVVFEDEKETSWN